MTKRQNRLQAIKQSLTTEQPINQPINLLLLLTELTRIAEQADRQRLTIFVDQFAADYPDIYEICVLLADAPPDRAMTALIEQWPALHLLTLHPKHLQYISLIQEEIKARKE